MLSGLSFRAAARHAGVTHKAIAGAVKAGRIPLLADGTVSPESVDQWSAGRRARRGGATRRYPGKSPRELPATTTQAPPTPKGQIVSQSASAAAPRKPPLDGINPDALASVLAGTGMFHDRASAELARDSYAARLRQLEYEEKAGKLLPTDRVVAAIAKATTSCKSRLLAIPAERAPMMHRCKSPAELEDALRDAITEALQDLSISFGPAAA